jgi:hypothetical protein
MRRRYSRWRSLASQRLGRCGYLCGNNGYRRIAVAGFEFGLPAARIVTEIAIEPAVRHAVGTGRLGVHPGMHVMVTLHLGRRAVRAFMVIFDLICHPTGLQCEVQPDSHKQSEGAAAPGSTLFSDAGQVTQVLVPARISALLPNSCTEAIGTDPERQGQTSLRSEDDLQGKLGGPDRRLPIVVVIPYVDVSLDAERDLGCRVPAKADTTRHGTFAAVEEVVEIIINVD